MSLLDNLGNNTQQSQTQSTQNNMIANLNKVSQLVRSRNMNPRDLAMNFLNQSNKQVNSQLKQFLHNSGVSDEQMQQAGLNL